VDDGTFADEAALLDTIKAAIDAHLNHSGIDGDGQYKKARDALGGEHGAVQACGECPAGTAQHDDAHRPRQRVGDAGEPGPGVRVLRVEPVRAVQRDRRDLTGQTD